MDDRKPGGEAIPALSVVVISINSAGLLGDCLSALNHQPDSGQMEILVISKQSKECLPAKDEPAPPTHWHKVPETETVPAMRRLGIEYSKAEFVALLEDDCIVGPGWYESVLAAHRSGYEYVGGAIEPGSYKRGLDWGVFYCEYARFLLPLSGIVNALPGNNVSYDKNALSPELIRQGFHEVFVHERWRKSGHHLYAADGMVVSNRNTWRLKHCTSMSFHHGRAYAGQRFGREHSARRFLYGVLAVALPLVKTVRTMREVISRKRTELPLFKALPWILIFHSCWALGECAGYLSGPGHSIEKWG